MRGFRIIWLLVISRERDDETDPDAAKSPALLRWAIVGLAVLGIAAVVVARIINHGALL